MRIRSLLALKHFPSPSTEAARFLLNSQTFPLFFAAFSEEIREHVLQIRIINVLSRL